EFELPEGGGFFSVEIVRPRGRETRRDVRVEPGERRQERFELEASMRGYLGWQQLAGVVKKRPVPEEKMRTRYRGSETARAASFGVPKGVRFSKGADDDEPPGLTLPRGAGPSEAGGAPGEPEAPKAPRPVSASVPETGAETEAKTEAPARLRAVELPRGEGAWRLAGRPNSAEPGALSPIAQAWPKPRTDGGVLTWLLKTPPDGDPETLRWIEISSGSNVDLASIPWRWWQAAPSSAEGLRLFYSLDRPSPVAGATPASPGSSVVSVFDSRWFSLLEFLSAGEVHTASALFDRVSEKQGGGEGLLRRALAGKLRRPLVAAAAAILLIAREESGEAQPWDPWLENLERSFPSLPDGALLLGCRRIEQAENEGDLKAAFAHLEAGIARGLPYFSATVSLLSLALSRIAGAVPGAEEARRLVSPVAARLDTGQPFTVLRLRP
ncbi:MAG: hypothetical protein AAF725_08400, partial [Acidobacteriota bacterium]